MRLLSSWSSIQYKPHWYIISLSFYGTIIVQSINYYFSFPNDSRATKSLVFFLFTFETFHVYLLSHTFWVLLVPGRSVGLVVLLDFSWQQVAAFAVSSLITFVVQCFFALRVWKVSGKNGILTSIIGITAALQLGSGMVFTANSARNKIATAIYDPAATKAARIELISTLICDLTISASLVYYFYTIRVGTKKTNAILQQLIILSVNMGLLLCLAAAVTLILFEVKSGTALLSVPYYFISRLYVNSLIATLNSRKNIRKIAEKTIEFTLPTIDINIPSFDVGSTSGSFVR